ncbi:MAG: hypothetical protein GY765_31220 [bacterium]|nr:hypothetical protein [bacterium]
MKEKIIKAVKETSTEAVKEASTEVVKETITEIDKGKKDSSGSCSNCRRNL